jgi:hypothetical protein
MLGFFVGKLSCLDLAELDEQSWSPPHRESKPGVALRDGQECPSPHGPHVRNFFSSHGI